MVFSLIRLSKDHWPMFIFGNVGALGNLFLPIILTRLLPPSEIGIYKTFFLYFMFLPFLFLAGGPVNSVLYWTGKSEPERSQYIKNSWGASLLLSCLCILLLPFTSLLSANVNLSQTHLILLLLTAALVCPSGHFNEVCVAEGRRFKAVFLYLSFEGAKIAGFIFLAWKYRTADSLIRYFSILMFLSFLFMTYLGIKGNALALIPDFNFVKKIIKYSAPVSLGSLFYFVLDKADLLFLSSMLQEESYAYYSIGILVFPPLLILESSVQQILIPQVSASYNKKDLQGMAESFRNAIDRLSFLIIPASAGLFIFASPIMEILYTPVYASSAKYLAVFSLSYLLLIIPHDSAFRASGKSAELFKCYLFAVPVFLCAIYFISINYPPMAVLISSLIAKLLFKIYCFQKSLRIMNLDYRDVIPLKKIKLYLTLAAILGATSYLFKEFFSSESTWFLVCGPVFAVLYLYPAVSQNKNSLSFSV